MFSLAICRDGWARLDADWVFARWVLCLSLDGTAPLTRYRNGGPRGLHKPVSGKNPPDWMRRAQAWVKANGGCSAEEGELVVEWYRTHRTGHLDAGWLRNGAMAAK